MATDPVDTTLQRSGIDPSPAFVDDLESVLIRFLEGDQISTVASPVSGGNRLPRRRILVTAAAAAVAVIAIVGVIALRDEPDRRLIVNAPTSDASLPLETTPPTAPATAIPTTPTPATASPTTATPATATPPAVTTLTPPLPATIDITSSSPRLEPTQVASYPIVAPGDLFQTAYAAPAGGERIAVLDDVTGIVRFVDATTGGELASYPTDIPTIGSETVLERDLLVGPDDVLYVNERDSGADAMLVAYGRSDDRYVEVGRLGLAPDADTLVLARAGVAEFGAMDAPLMPYVTSDGRPSGATLDISDATVAPIGGDGPASGFTFQRAGRSWNIDYFVSPGAGLPPQGACPLCVGFYAGPDGSVVLVNQAPQPDGDLLRKVTVLSDAIVSYDTDWNYVGSLGSKLLFVRLDQDSIDIGTVQP